eukprot:scaffold7685_cov65-Cylindrotheca_fusiformis.AAC.1
MRSQLSTPGPQAVQIAQVTPAKNLIHGGSGLPALHRMKSNLEAGVRNFATKFVFPKAKFLQSELTAKQYCMLAVANNNIALPASATVGEFAAMFHRTLEKRVRQIRLNSNTGARVKFIGTFVFSSKLFVATKANLLLKLTIAVQIADLKQGKVPEGFSYKTLRNGYRDYIIKDNDSEEKKEKKKVGLEAFHYFVDRILAS